MGRSGWPSGKGIFMSGPAPWSVKGIDPRAREAAREAARQRGLTIGEWLNQAILANEAALAAAREHLASDTPPGPEAQNTEKNLELLHQALSQLAERVDTNDRRAASAIGAVDRSLSAIGKRLESAQAEAEAGDGRVDSLLQELREAQSALLRQMSKLEEEEIAAIKAERAHDRAGFASVEENVSNLAERVAGAEAQTGEALRALETSLVSLDEKITRAGGEPERLAILADDFSAKVDDVRAQFAGQIAAALDELKPEDTRSALADLSKRIAATERRHAQTIEAVSIEIKRMSEQMERRLRGIEMRNDDGVAAREQMRDGLQAIDRRMGAMEEREGVAFAHLSDEMGKIADRIEDRVIQSEHRSADALQQVGEHVALVAERLHERQDRLVEEVSDRIHESEQRHVDYLNQAIENMSTALDKIEARAAGSSPMNAAMGAFAERLQAIEARIGAPAPQIKTPQYAPQRAPERAPHAAPAAAPAPAMHSEPDDSEFNPVVEAIDSDLEGVDFEPVTTPGEVTLLDDAAIASHHASLKEMASDLAARAVELHGEENPETIFVEDIEARFRTRDFSETGEPLPPPLPEGVLGDDPFAQLSAELPGEEDEDLFWSMGDAKDVPPPPFPEPSGTDDDDMFSAYAAEPLGDTTEDNDFIDDMALDHTHRPGSERSIDFASPSSRSDYISAARRAAQMSAPTEMHDARGKEKKSGGGFALLFTAGAAAAVAAGAYYYNQHGMPEVLRPYLGMAPATPAPAPEKLADAPPGSIGEAVRAQEEGAAPPAAGAIPLETPATGGEDAEAPLRARPLNQIVSGAPITLENAAAQGDARAQFELALALTDRGDASNAAGLLKRAADQGLAVAQYRLAKAYERGEGVTRDAGAARRLTEQAARAGNTKAMHDLGVYLAKSEGAALDEAGAFNWFRQAAQFGVPDSQFNLGVLYQQGRGVVADTSLAYYWFEVAANAGDKTARARAAMLERDLGAKASDIRARARTFQPNRAQAFANGEFGARPWSNEAVASAADRTRS